MSRSNFLILRSLLAFFFLCSLILGISPAVYAEAQADATHLVVSPSVMHGWAPYQDKSAPGFASLVSGPAAPPAGQGSARLRVTASDQAPLFGTSEFMNVRLAHLTTLSYATYVQPGSSAAQAPALFLEVDYEDPAHDLPYEGRLTYEPYLNGTVNPGGWQTWDALAGGNARWWSSRAPFNTTCPQSVPCTLATVLSTWPDVRVSLGLGVKAGSGWANFDGNFDLLTLAVPGISKSFDFEPPAVTYVDDNWASVVPASDPDGAGPAIAFGMDAFAKIQDAIDAVAPGGVVNVYPGSYNETAADKILYNGGGPYQFGLFVGSAKTAITVRGIDAAGAPILDQANVLANITTNATNNFGTSGIFIEADGVTFSGLKVLQNIPGDNKTIEVIGDNFSLLDAVIDVPYGGSVYLNDWRFAGDVSHLKAYHIEGTRFAQAASLDIASGAGYSGPTSGRVITNNIFEYNPTAYWPAISFSGTVPSVGWFVHPVSGAQITGNTFSGGVQYIRARGEYDETSFDWASFWNNNTFDKAVMAGAALPASPRAFSYTSGSYTFNNVRRIGALIQAEIDNAVSGDTVLVKSGTYAESPNITKSIHLRSESGRDLTTITLQSGPTYLGSLTISGADVTVEGFTITGFDASEAHLASSNIFLTPTPRTVSILNNRLQVGNIADNSNGDDGFGLITSYAIHSDPAADVATLLVQGNLFEPLNADGWRAFYINPGVNAFTFRQNSITGSFGGRATTQARNGLVEENTLTGTGASGGLATWGYPTPSIYGKTTFRNNLITGTQKAISVTSTENVTILNNDLRDNAMGVWVGNSASTPLTFNPATIQVHNNSLTASSEAALKNEESGSLNATQNWWDSPRGPQAAGNPLGNGGQSSGAAQYDPWLCDGTDTDPAIGFQPGSAQCTNQPVHLVFSTQPATGIATLALPVQPVVRVEGANGELAVNFSEAITLLLANNPGGAVLSGQISLNAVDGIAAFVGLSLDKPADGYALLAWASVGVKASAAFNILPFEANLSVTHTAVPAVVLPNAAYSITLGVTNSGPAPAAELSLSDTLPAGVSLVSAAGDGWTCAEALNVVTCTRPNLASGASASVTLALKAPAAPGLLSNQAVISSSVPDPAAANNTTSASTTVVAVPVTGGITYFLPSVSR